MRRLSFLALISLSWACDASPPPDADADAIASAVREAVRDELAAHKGSREALVAGQTELQAQLNASADQVALLGAQLDALDAKLDTALAAPSKPTPKPARPGRPDPSRTYKVAIGDAHTQGPDTALVTLVEWSDFE